MTVIDLSGDAVATTPPVLLVQGPSGEQGTLIHVLTEVPVGAPAPDARPGDLGLYGSVLYRVSDTAWTLLVDLRGEIPDVSNLITEGELAAVVVRLQALEDAPAVDLSGLTTDAEHSALVTRVDALEAIPVPDLSGLATDGELAAMASRVQALEDTPVVDVSGLATDAELSALSARVQGLEDAPAVDLSGLATDSELAAVAGRVTAAENVGSSNTTRVAAVEARPSGGAMSSALQPARVVEKLVQGVQAGHGWTFQTPGVGAQVDDTTVFAVGSQSLKLTTNGAGGVTFTRKTGLALDLTARVIKLAVRVDDVSKVADLILYLSSDNMTNSVSARIYPSTQPAVPWIQNGEWAMVTMSLGEFSTSANVNLAAINALQLRVKDRGTGAFSAWLGGIWSSPRPSKGVVSLTFDDGWDSQYLVARKVMDTYRMPGTLYVIDDIVGTAGRVTVDNLQTLERVSGWELGAHSHTLATHDARWTTLTPAVLDAEFAAQREWFRASGLRPPESAAYPGGYTSVAVEDVVRRHFAAGRSIYSVQRETLPAPRVMRLRTWSLTNTDTLATVKAAVDRAAANNEWLILCFHKLVTTPTISTEWSSADFQSLVDYIAAANVDVRTVAEGLRSAPAASSAVDLSGYTTTATTTALAARVTALEAGGSDVWFFGS